jgi:HSP20 family protein
MSDVMRRETGQPTRTHGDGHPARTEEFVQPRASVFERKDDVILELEMPGVSRDRIDVTVEKDELTVTGWRGREDYSKCEVLASERANRAFRRSFVLSESIDTQKVAATCENGVLKLTLPKVEKAKPKKIEIR